jgi:molecular chaperone GrpE (heat shock protein)
MPGLVAAGRRIEDDADAHAPDDFRRQPLVEQKAAPWLAPAADFSETGSVNDLKNWKVPKWPFLLGDALLLVAAYFLVQQAPHPIGRWETVTAAACVALGAILGAMPFILDYRAIVKVIEAGALGSIAEKIQNLEKLAAQINAATNEWTNAQTQAEKTAVGAKEISDKMTEEVRQFSEFMQKINDSEKAALRLEIEKFRRGESEWLQVLVRILDNIFMLHAAATRSGQPKLAEQITQFQNACRDAARRIGLAPFSAEPDAPFNAERHQAAGIEGKPSAAAVVAETVGAGFTFQGRLLRPALVRLRQMRPPGENPAREIETPEPAADEKAQDELLLQPPD